VQPERQDVGRSEQKKQEIAWPRSWAGRKLYRVEAMFWPTPKATARVALGPASPLMQLNMVSEPEVSSSNPGGRIN
jgi:hypothetical protein